MWRGKYWRRWSEAVAEAGLQPNRMNEGHGKEKLIECLVALTRSNRRFPTYADVRMGRQADPTFPTHQAFSNLGSLPARIDLVRSYATKHPEHRDVLELLPAADAEESSDAGAPEVSDLADGSVYMLKLGRHYKVGKTFDVPRRHRLSALPEGAHRPLGR